MTPFFHDDHLTLYGGDCRDVLRELPDESVHCVVTSPPYWGLRDYGTASWDGGDPECRHEGDGAIVGNNMNVRGKDEAEMKVGGWDKAEDHGNQYRAVAMGGSCRKCGARRIDSQLGLEATPEEFVANMVDVFREVRRVLRRDGTLWLNLGDSYAANGNGGGGGASSSTLGATDGKPGRGVKQWDTTIRAPKVVPSGLKPKDLVGIPWRVAFALQADGWYLRSDIIWAKPNPMPESVTDRPTKAHEYLFLLTRSPRYYYDAEAVREKVGEPTRRNLEFRGDTPYKNNGSFDNDAVHLKGTSPAGPDELSGRNLRSVWNIATEPYPGAHFATFPRKLVEPCVKAGTSERGVCPECGAPWVRVVEVSPMRVRPTAKREAWQAEDDHARTQVGGTILEPRTSETTGWKPSCAHGIEPHHLDQPLGGLIPYLPVPAVVLDPFAGSGTTLFVAQALGRRGVGIDLSPDYLKQALERNRQTPLGLVG